MLGNGNVTRAEAMKVKTVVSGSKLGKDLVEQARFAYAIDPQQFAKLAKLQGFIIEDENDAITLAKNTLKDPNYFNFGRLMRTMKVSSSKLVTARRKINVM